MRIDAPDRASSSTQAATKMIVSPKLGCCISSSAMTPVSTAVSGTTGSDASFSFSDSSQAMVTMNSGFRNSDGWNWVKPDAEPAPRAVHLVPMTGTRNSRTVKRTAPTIDSRRAVALGSIETPIITGTRERDPDQLAVEIIERREADAAARIARWPAAGEAAATAIRPIAISTATRISRTLVDLPEPAAERAPVGAAEPRRLRRRSARADPASRSCQRLHRGAERSPRAS